MQSSSKSRTDIEI